MQSPVRDFVARAYTVGVSGSAESGKTTLLLALCRLLRDNYSLAVVTRKPAPGVDGSRDFLLRHKALGPSRIAAFDEDGHSDLAIEWLMTECRPELIFVEHDEADTDPLPDFTIHVINRSAEEMSSEDVIGAETSDLLVLNKTHLGPPLDPQHQVSIRESVRMRGEAPYVFTQLRYGIGTIEIARQVLGSWRQTSAPEAWAVAPVGHVLLAPA
jgi:urease accessory protein